MTPSVVGMVLAGGSAARAGGMKALARLGDATFLEHAVATLRSAGCARVVVVISAPLREPVAQLGLDAEVEENPHPERGMLSSLQVASSALTAAPLAVISLVDHPRVRPATVTQLVKAWEHTGADVLRPRRGTRTGHPIVVSAAALAALRAAGTSLSIRDVLQSFRKADVDVDDDGVLDDLDTIGDIQAVGGVLPDGS